MHLEWGVVCWMLSLHVFFLERMYLSEKNNICFVTGFFVFLFSANRQRKRDLPCLFCYV